ncbi:hypothetical protein SAMN05216352_11154 [Alteribacillus bidgolensis]|uniref:Uncharacterized protein n=1 Tax=Alteribacillus bidgolensis TaxID=930129 RepID=A0A1G8N0J6_9BACI|nr:hypothetical protein SAMN05216352_11154 [Alteribacillus bidgolensis]
MKLLQNRGHADIGNLLQSEQYPPLRHVIAEFMSIKPSISLFYKIQPNKCPTYAARPLINFWDKPLSGIILPHHLTEGQIYREQVVRELNRSSLDLSPKTPHPVVLVILARPTVVFSVFLMFIAGGEETNVCIYN